MTDLASLAGPSALLAAAATVVGAVTLVIFFAKGGWWGLANDVASIVLMLATIPVAVGIAQVSRSWFAFADGAAASGVIGMIGASVSQGLLIARRFTYQQLLPWTLGFGAVVGVWYLLIGLGSVTSPFFPDGLLNALAIVSGVSFIALGYGFLRGNERHPLSVIGGLVLVVTSTWFLVWVGLLFTSGDIGDA
jgi:hypothetical protein